MWANTQRDGRPAEYRWRPVLNAAKFGSRPLLDCRAVTLPIWERKTWRTQTEYCTWQNSVTEQQPPKMYIQSTSPGKGQTLWNVWLASVERRRCSNEAKTRKPLKLAGCPKLRKRSQPLASWSSPYCEDMWRRYWCLTFFPIVDTCLVAKISPTKLCDGARTAIFWRFLRPAFPASRVQYISICILNSHWGHTMCGSIIQSATVDVRRGKKKEEEETRKKPQGKT